MTAVSRSALAESYDHCRDVSRREAKNFDYGMKLTPEPKRSAMYAVYAWNRLADDLADEPGDPEAKEQRLTQFRRNTRQALADDQPLPDGPLWPAFRDTALTYELPAEYFEAMVDGQMVDQQRTRYATFDELYEYCYKVASVVGLTCLEIWGYEGGADTRKLGEYRGIAFQLTNILRDVREDAERDRVYLPAETCGLFELNPSMFRFDPQPEVIRGIRELAERAGEFFEQSAALESRVHPSGRACLWAMTAIYRGLLRRIAADPMRPLRGRRVRLSKPRKLWIGLRASLMRGSASGVSP